MSDDIYSSDAVNVLTIQNGITFLTSLTSLVTRIQLARPKFDHTFFLTLLFNCSQKLRVLHFCKDQLEFAQQKTG